MRDGERGDGRNIDPAIGSLLGEGAQQRVDSLERAHPVPAKLSEEIPSQASYANGQAVSYYGSPVIKEPVWIATIPAYFYVGGAAGASSLLGAVSELLGGERLARLCRLCRFVGFAGDSLSAGLLIVDLGRPSRFLNMLRVVRVSSPMSLGSWVLSASGAFNGLSAILSWQRRGALGRIGNAASLGAGVLGIPLAGYTAVLLTNTAVPVWQGTYRSLPYLFMSSAVASAGALLSLFDLNREEARVVSRFSLMGKVAALASAQAVEWEASRVSRVAVPFQTGFSGVLWRASSVLTAASLGLSLVPGRRRWVRTAAAILETAGALAMRYSIFHAGKRSARDPLATFEAQRLGLGAREVETESAVAQPLLKPQPV